MKATTKATILLQTMLEDGLPDWYSEDRLMLLSLVGSRGYRLHTEDSDYDYFAIVMPPVECIIGADTWESYSAQEGIVDLKVYSPKKYMDMCMKGSVNALEPLFMGTLQHHRWMEGWFAQADKFVTASTVDSILGYTVSTLKRFTDPRGSEHGAKRRELIERYGYDCSAAAHCVRWLSMGWEMLFNGANHLIPDLEDYPVRKVVMNIKHGQLPVLEVTEIIQDYFFELQKGEAKLKERLGELDRNVANEVLTTLHLNGLVL